MRNIQGFREWGRGGLDAGRFEPAWDAGRDTHGRGWSLMIFCARATRGLRRPSPGLTARLGVPMGGRVRKLRAVEDQSAPIPEEITSKLGGSYFYGEGARDARTRGSNRLSPKEVGKRAWGDGEGGLLISCARATRGLRRERGAARPSSCSQSPHDETVVA